MKRLLGLVCFFVASLVLAAAPDLNPGRWAKAVEEFALWDSKNSTPANAILFVGSSSIVYWPTADSFPNFPVVNRGFGGSQISDVNHYFDKVVSPHTPAKIVLYAGDNDIAFGKTPEDVFADFKAFANLVRQKVGDAEILFLSIKPSLARWELWPQMRKANQLVSDYMAEQQDMTYVDLATVLLNEEGEPGEFFVADGLHLNSIGYLVWTQTLTPYLRDSS